MEDSWMLGACPWQAEREWPGGGWEVLVRFPHVSGAKVFRWMYAPAVVDDFGDLVLVGPLQ